MTALYIVAAVLVLYAGLMYWLVFGRGEFRTAYNPLIAWLFKRNWVTIGARAYGRVKGRVLSVRGEKHERFHHSEWRRQPLSFLPRYLYEYLRYGYIDMPLEVKARAAMDA